MERLITEQSYYDQHGEMPFITYNNLVEKGLIWRYFDKLDHDEFAEMVINLVTYFKTYDQEYEILELGDIDFNYQYTQYTEHCKKQAG